MQVQRAQHNTYAHCTVHAHIHINYVKLSRMTQGSLQPVAETSRGAGQLVLFVRAVFRGKKPDPLCKKGSSTAVA